MTKIKKNGIRILLPSEYESLLASIPKLHHQLLIKTMLLTGMRFREIKRLHENPKWYDKRGFIFLNKEGQKKKKARFKERYVKLSILGNEVVSTFINTKMTIPSRVSLNEDLGRWGKNAGLDTDGLSIKTFRKTWESWLIASMPEKTLEITLSQGHTETTSMKFYINIPFTAKDKEGMKKYILGW